MRTVVDVGGSFFSDILPVIQTVPGRDGVFIAELLGVDFVEPWAMLIAPEPGEKGNVIDLPAQLPHAEGLAAHHRRAFPEVAQ